MYYTRFFRRLREAKGLTIEELASLADRHRNTVSNLESGRPVKFKTIAELMVKMGYATGSAEMKTIALLWLEAVSGLPFSRPETEAVAKKALADYRTHARHALQRLEQEVTQAGLTSEQISLLVFAVRHPAILAILESVRDFATEPIGDASPALEFKVAEDP